MPNPFQSPQVRADFAIYRYRALTGCDASEDDFRYLATYDGCFLMRCTIHAWHPVVPIKEGDRGLDVSYFGE